ncbi:FHA domain-containing protein [Streptomyces sp. NPDC004267]|uniref:FHA domain-containing protein n=1 Tax=Streptomyces sp. NPDC004267 TaxID=3364694 RepID=UPI00367C8A28
MSTPWDEVEDGSGYAVDAGDDYDEELDGPPRPPRRRHEPDPAAPAAAPVAVLPDPSVGPAVLRFMEVGLTLSVAPGTVAGLGRDPEWAPGTAGALGPHRTVSARHASVAVAADGTATVTEEPPGAVNGTRLNGTDLIAGRPYPLTDGDRVWLGARISCTVTLGRRC